MADTKQEFSGVGNGAVLSPANDPALAVDKSVEKIREEDYSDNDAGERPVREKLKKTSIAGLPKHPIPAAESKDETSEGKPAMGTQPLTPALQGTAPGSHMGEQRGRPARKRSFEDLRADDPASDKEAENRDNLSTSEKTHKRMRSRDVNPAQHLSMDASIAKDNDSASVRPGVKSSEVPASAMTTEITTLTPPPPENMQMYDAAQTVASPKKKRSRDQFDKDGGNPSPGLDDLREQTTKSGSEEVEGNEMTQDTILQDTKGEPEKKRHRDLSQDRNGVTEAQSTTTKANTSSGFGNTSSTSPFGALASTKPLFGQSEHSKEDIGDSGRVRTTSPSAFASSGLSAFARSSSSPFGALGTSSSSGFGTLGSSSAEKPLNSGFGAPLGSSSSGGSAPPFASSGSGFGRLGGSGFGGGLGTGFAGAPRAGDLTTFAASGGNGIIGTSVAPQKAFGAPADEDDDNEDAEGSEGSDKETQEEKHKDKRFVEQEIETGEEGENTIFSCRAKLFHFNGQEWKERGVGTFKVNITETGTETETDTSHHQKARLIMRTDGVHRVVLNTPVFKGMKFGSNDGKEPSGKMINLAGMENGRPVPLLLKTGSADVAKDLYHKIDELKEDL